MRRKQSINKVYSADEAIDRLGGPRIVADLLSTNDRVVDERVVWNWRKRGFPWHRYPEIGDLLRREGLRFSTNDVFARMGKRNGGAA
jgi:hypothetical protein